jgi:hypothetical protein
MVRLKQVAADPLHSGADPNPLFQFDADPDPLFLALSDKNLRPMVYKNLYGFILSLCASTMSVYGTPLP